MQTNRRPRRTWYQQGKEHARLLWRMGWPLDRIERTLAGAEPSQKTADRRTIQRWITEWEAALPEEQEWTFGDLEPDDERLAMECWATAWSGKFAGAHGVQVHLPTVELARLMAGLRRAFPDLDRNAAYWIAGHYSSARAFGEPTLALDLALALGAYRDNHSYLNWLSALRSRNLQVSERVVSDMEPPEHFPDLNAETTEDDLREADIRDRQNIRLFHVARRMGVVRDAPSTYTSP